MRIVHDGRSVAALQGGMERDSADSNDNFNVHLTIEHKMKDYGW